MATAVLAAQTAALCRRRSPICVARPGCGSAGVAQVRSGIMTHHLVMDCADRSMAIGQLSHPVDRGRHPAGSLGVPSAKVSPSDVACRAVERLARGRGRGRGRQPSCLPGLRDGRRLSARRGRAGPDRRPVFATVPVGRRARDNARLGLRRSLQSSGCGPVVASWHAYRDDRTRVAHRGCVRPRTIAWAELDRFRLAYYSTRRDRKQRLDAARTRRRRQDRLALDLEPHQPVSRPRVVRRAAAVALTRGISSSSEATAANLEAAGRPSFRTWTLGTWGRGS